MATNYSIHTGTGDEICAGIQLRSEALKVAQGHADRRGESVWMADGGDGDAEEITPNLGITFEVCEEPSLAPLGSILLTCAAWLTEADGTQFNGPETVYLLALPGGLEVDYPEARDAAVSFARSEKVHGYLWEVTGDDSSRRLYSVREDGRWYAIT